MAEAMKVIYESADDEAEVTFEISTDETLPSNCCKVIVLASRLDISTYTNLNSKVKINNYESQEEAYKLVKDIILTDKKTSISYVQRQAHMSYNYVSEIMEQLEIDGILSSPNDNGVRTILWHTWDGGINDWIILDL